jgi:hypothetical protein
VLCCVVSLKTNLDKDLTPPPKPREKWAKVGSSARRGCFWAAARWIGNDRILGSVHA